MWALGPPSGAQQVPLRGQSFFFPFELFNTLGNPSELRYSARFPGRIECPAPLASFTTPELPLTPAFTAGIRKSHPICCLHSLRSE